MTNTSYLRRVSGYQCGCFRSGLHIFAKMRNPLRTHYEEFATSADLDGIARTVDAKSHWMERSFWVGLLAGKLQNFREF
jgi:hypothetical protein